MTHPVHRENTNWVCGKNAAFLIIIALVLVLVATIWLPTPLRERFWTSFDNFYRDGSFDHDWQERIDAMEYDPNHTALMKDAEREAKARMKAESVSGLGSCHAYWSYKEEYLANHGYDWKAPSELNTTTCYD